MNKYSREKFVMKDRRNGNVRKKKISKNAIAPMNPAAERAYVATA